MRRRTFAVVFGAVFQSARGLGSRLQTLPWILSAVAVAAVLLTASPSLADYTNYCVSPPLSPKGSCACTSCPRSSGCTSCTQTCPCPGAAPGTLGDAILANPILLLTGSVVESTVDLSLPGPVFGWQHRRFYDSMMSTLVNGNELPGFNGQRWTCDPYAMFIKKPTGSTDIELYLDASHKVVFTWNTQNSTYSSPSDMDVTLTIQNAGAANETYTLTALRTGDVYVFYGLSASVTPSNSGWIKERTTRLYQQVLHQSGTTYSYNSRGLVTQITTASPQAYNIVYSYCSGALMDMLQEVDVYDTSVNPPKLISKVVYNYYDPTNPPSSYCGSTGDLLQAKVTQIASDGSSIVRTTQYRYCGGSGTITGGVHQLKMVFEPDAVQRAMTANNCSTPEGLLTLPDSLVQNYASRSFSYYTSNFNVNSVTTCWLALNPENLNVDYAGGSGTSNVYNSTLPGGWVQSETVNGACSSCGGSSGSNITNTYYFLNLHGFVGPPGDDNQADPNMVVLLIVEDTTDADSVPVRRTIYGLNALGNELRRIVIMDPTQTQSLTTSCTSTTLTVTNGPRIAEQRKPSAHAGMVTTNSAVTQFLDPYFSGSWSNDSATVNSNAGEIFVYEYNTTTNGNFLYPSGVRVKNGSNGTSNYLSATDNYDTTTDDPTLPQYTYVYPKATTSRTDSSRVTTAYAYTYWNTNCDVQGGTTTLPTVTGGTNGQNGSGVATTTQEYYDNAGRLRWTSDGEGVVNYYSYHPNLGGMAYQATDVDPSNLSSDITSGDNGAFVAWSGNVPFSRGISATALALVTENFYDNQGRQIMTIPPDGFGAGGSVTYFHYTVYGSNATSQTPITYQFPYCNSSGVPQLPISVTQTDANGRPTSSYTVDPTKAATANNVPTGLASGTSQSNYVSWTNYNYDSTSGQLSSVDRYFSIPAGGTGTLGTNCYTTNLIYDRQGRKAATAQYVGSSGSSIVSQVNVTQFDYLDRPTDGYKGVATTATMPSVYSDIYSGGTSPVSTYLHVTNTQYDVDNNVVTQINYYDASNYANYTGVTYHLNFRGQVQGVEPFYASSGGGTTSFSPNQVMDLDWLGRTTASASFVGGSVSWSDVISGGTGTYAAGTSTSRRSLSKTIYDPLGRVYETQQYWVDPASGGTSTTTGYLKTDNYYDRNDRLVARASPGRGATEMAYDAAGRQYQTRVVKAPSATLYDSSGAFQYCAPAPNPVAGSMSGSAGGVIEISHSVLDAGGRPLEQHRFELNHDDTSGGINLGGSNYVRSTVFNWYDAAGRILTSGNYGCGSGSGDSSTTQWTYTTAPVYASENGSGTSSASVLFTQYAYDSISGLQGTVTMPSSTGGTTSAVTFYDNLGRTIYSVENSIGATCSGGSLSTTGGGANNDQNKVTQFVYNGLGRQTSLAAWNTAGTSGGTSSQTTIYSYDTTVDASRLTMTTYPDLGTVTTLYNLDGAAGTRTDQRGVTLTYNYRPDRRLDNQSATLPTSGTVTVDSNVQCIGYVYDDIGRVNQVTSYAGTGTTSTVVNQVYYTFEGLGRKQSITQMHAGTASGTVSGTVSYLYDYSPDGNGACTNGSRLLSVTYPDSRVVSYGYSSGGTDTVDNAISRVVSVSGTDSSSAYATYYYNGVGRPVISQLGNGVTLNLALGTATAATSGVYAGLDRFGRTIEQRWVVGSTSWADIQYGYDLAGNRITHQDVVADSKSQLFDELYTYDGLNRLSTRNRGQLASGTLSSTTSGESWALDAMGNFTGYSQSSGAGTTTQSGNQFSLSNELIAFNTTRGTQWQNPLHDPAGNMYIMPQPNSPANSYTAVYDAWNRLTQVSSSGSTPVAQYQYDGLNRRTVKFTGSSNEIRHFYYNDQWQVLEEAVGTSTSADRENVWGAQYTDELVLRDNYGGTGTGRFYALQDANWNVVAIAGTDSTVAERYTYSAYGMPEFRDANFVALSSGSSGYVWDTLYTGRQYDPETGLQYSRNRCYHPVLGRFISRDPAGYRGGINLYEYVGDDPLVRTDPYGLDGCDKPAPQPKPAPKPAPKPCENAIYYCERDIQPGGADSGDKIARACHWKHIDIYSVCEGQIYHGAGGGQTGSDPGLPKGPGVTCHKVHRQDYYDDWPFAVERKLRWGPKAGTPCSKATMSDIIKCLQARTTDVKPGLVDNCQTDCDSALGECCMSGFTPLTIVPQYPTIPPGGHF